MIGHVQSHSQDPGQIRGILSLDEFSSIRQDKLGQVKDRAEKLLERTPNLSQTTPERLTDMGQFHDMEQLMNPSTVNYGEKLSPPKEGTKAWVNTWSAGHGCSVIDDIPSAGELIDRLIEEFKESIVDQNEKTKSFLS